MMLFGVMASLDDCGVFSWPVERFVSSRLRSLVPSLDQGPLLQLCHGFDSLSSQSAERSFVGLEIDHRSSGSVDCYLSGGEGIFSLLGSEKLPQVSSCFRRWLPPFFHLEYDYSGGDYCFAGFSQRCAFDGASLPEILLAIEDFIALNVGPAAVASFFDSGVNALIARFGGPVHLAVMSGRNRYWLKLVLPLSLQSLHGFNTYLHGDGLVRQLFHLCDALPFLVSCVALLPKGSCKLSLDLDLGSATVSERIGIELTTPRRDAARGCRQVEFLSRMLDPEAASIEGYQQMLALQAAIPFGERHTRTWTSDQDALLQTPIEQLFVVMASHIKLCLLPQSWWVKSYLGLCRLLVKNHAGAH